ncbi:hypothetical protein YK48G_09500 [Lentilactobacillus fungorum]|uniref:MucBP domain-containing protein n=1 Tax=Lentilactobacillus fungorum TaxID=2201250 RepID=A0ABQ3VX87_9LACO|nr:DUF5776 domain-containing protein [Lentilactobacillus fungorum]GHP13525.1 hypothetical protein YK48G_09500 [Lentilactobacillus fungorum]
MGDQSVAFAAADDGTLINVTKDNFDDYFTEPSGNNNTAKYDPNTGIINMVQDDSPNWTAQAGMSLLNGVIDMSKNFSMQGDIEITPGFDGTTYSDGVLFAFRPGDPTQIGNPGAGMGVGGIPNAFGVTLDTADYATDEAGRSEKDPGTPANPYVSFFQNIERPDLTAHNATDILPNSDWVKHLLSDNNNPQGLSYDNFGKDKWVHFNISIKNKVMTYTFTTDKADGSQSYTATRDFSGQISDKNPNMSLAISSGAQSSQANVNVKIDSLTFSAQGVVNVEYLDEDTNNKIADTQTLSGSLKDTAVIDPTEIQTLKDQGYRLDRVEAPAGYDYNHATLPFGGTDSTSTIPYTDVLQTIKYYFKKDAAKQINVNVIHEDADSHQVIGHSDTINGQFGETKAIPSQSISGYTPDSANPTSFKLGTLNEDGSTQKTIFLYYHKNSSATGGGLSGTTTASPVQPTNNQLAPTTSQSPATPTTSDGVVAKKGEVVYALKKIYMYKNNTFKKTDRIATYAKKPRINRPMFVVTDYARSQQGRLRYVVRDINHHSKTYGKRGMITANWNYVRPVYYRSTYKTLTVISPRGVNEYKNKDLTGKVRNYKQGTRLKVKGFVNHHLTTRYVLSNGHYVTGNRKLVISGKYKQPKQIKTKKSLYRYNNVNLGKRTKLIKKGTILTVKKWAYSHPYSTTNFGAKRYQIAGEYVTANSRYVTVIK